MPIKTMLLALFVLFTVTATPAQGADLSRFFGYYEGTAVTKSLEGGGEVKRDLKTEIRAYGSRGFSVAWTTISHHPDGRDKVSENDVNFEPESRPGVYGAAMRRTLFGEQEPLDPLKGDPYIWATVSGDAMTVHSMIIFEDGGYEIQSYVRSLVEGGLALEFQRVRNGERMHSISAEVRRTTPPKDR